MHEKFFSKWGVSILDFGETAKCTALCVDLVVTALHKDSIVLEKLHSKHQTNNCSLFLYVS